ncbi:conserved hypothetical protein [Ricinus communis]|uniref:Uncharacterized protein n=1 Tax=Ricinus communis TaxID=3988 RepID=B9TAB6_RICCO|nr:conserved hypothetical protein [Ricinus communis]
MRCSFHFWKGCAPPPEIEAPTSNAARCTVVRMCSSCSAASSNEVRIAVATSSIDVVISGVCTHGLSCLSSRRRMSGAAGNRSNVRRSSTISSSSMPIVPIVDALKSGR